MKDAYLVGGSALVLHFGHRYSMDLDFFTRVNFDPFELSHKLSKIGKFKEELAKGISVIGEFEAVKFSYFQYIYPYPLIAKATSRLGVKIASVEYIAAMKLVALMDRGTKRDFVDLYEITHQGFKLEMLFKYYDRKYDRIENNLFSIIKSLQYFDDAEETRMPQMIKTVSWEKVKKFFAEESVRLAKKYI